MEIHIREGRTEKGESTTAKLATPTREEEEEGEA